MIKRNNPANIRYSAFNNWKGQIGESNGFAVFDTLENGTRAQLIVMRSKINRGVDTISSIINEWAPFGDGDNNPVRYAQNVEAWTGIGMYKKLSFSDQNDIEKIARAITRQEHGISALNDQTEMLVTKEYMKLVAGGFSFPSFNIPVIATGVIDPTLELIALVLFVVTIVIITQKSYKNA